MMMDNPLKKRPQFSAVLKNRGFVFLWLGQLTSQLADRLYIYVLIVVAYSLTKSSLGVSVPMLAFGIPSILFGTLAGVFVDRWNRKGILIISDIFRGLLILTLVPFITKSLLLIFLVSFLIYTATQFFAPAETASIPELVKKENLIVANSFFMMTWMGASVIGFGLGAPLVSFFGKEFTFGLATALYLLSALAIFMVPLKFRGKRAQGKVVASMWRDLLVGLEFIRRKVVVRVALTKLFVATSGIAVVSVLAIVFAKEILGIGAENFGYLIISTGFGMFSGMAFLGRLSHYFKKGTIAVFGFLLSGIMFLWLSRISSIPAALVITFFLGVGNILVTTTIQTILHSKIPRVIRGRVFGVQNMLINSAFTLPVVLFGGLADLWGLRLAFALLGAIVLATGFLGILVPKFRTV